MTPADRITYCDDCGWRGERTEHCPDCELDERIRAADAVEIWQHACEMADHLRSALCHMPYPDRARKALKDWDTTKNAIIEP
jgi:hypothetical protein